MVTRLFEKFCNIVLRRKTKGQQRRELLESLKSPQQEARFRIRHKRLIEGAIIAIVVPRRNMAWHVGYINGEWLTWGDAIKTMPSLQVLKTTEEEVLKDIEDTVRREDAVGGKVLLHDSCNLLEYING